MQAEQKTVHQSVVIAASRRRALLGFVDRRSSILRGMCVSSIQQDSGSSRYLVLAVDARQKHQTNVFRLSQRDRSCFGFLPGIRTTISRAPSKFISLNPFENASCQRLNFLRVVPKVSSLATQNVSRQLRFGHHGGGSDHRNNRGAHKNRGVGAKQCCAEIFRFDAFTNSTQNFQSFLQPLQYILKGPSVPVPSIEVAVMSAFILTYVLHQPTKQRNLPSYGTT